MDNNKDNMDNNMDNNKDNNKDNINNGIENSNKENADKKNTNSKRKIRCHYCNKKINMLQFKCKCNNTFCIKHQLPHNLNCSYNFKNDIIKQISKNNPKIYNKSIIIP